MARIVLNTFGSFGDLHPYLAVAIALKQRGHHPVVATAEVYRLKIEAEGIAFAPIRPNVGDLLNNAEFVKKLWDPRRGSEHLIRDYIMPTIEQSFDDLLVACGGADLLLTHVVTYAAPLVAEKLNLPWLSVVLQPTVLFSAHDPPVLPHAPWLRHLHALGPKFMQAVFQIGRLQTASWIRPVAALRRRVGLPASKAHPIFEGQFSPFGTLAWFSKHFAAPQPDWPSNTRITGFPFYDRRGAGFDRSDSDEKMRDLMRFVDRGSAPLLFTLGSSAVMDPGSFYQESLKAAERMDLRAVLLCGLLPRSQFPEPIPSSIHLASYAPYSAVMPRCAASVHQGGIGTTAQALRAGRPMIVVPWAHDQPDNAYRVERLGLARVIRRGDYTAATAARELAVLLDNEKYAVRAIEVGKKIASENGIAAACAAIEEACQSSTIPRRKV